MTIGGFNPLFTITDADSISVSKGIKRPSLVTIGLTVGTLEHPKVVRVIPPYIVAAAEQQAVRKNFLRLAIRAIPKT
jgi:hypothetical protein